MSTLRHVGLIVSDIDKALSIYRDILGFNPKIDQIESGEFYEHLTGITSGKARTLKCYSSDGTCIELIQYLSPESKEIRINRNDLGAAHIAFYVEDIDKFYNDKSAQGLSPINQPAEHRDDNGTLIRKVMYAQDPDGNWLEFVELL